MLAHPAFEHNPYEQAVLALRGVVSYWPMNGRAYSGHPDLSSQNRPLPFTGGTRSHGAPVVAGDGWATSFDGSTRYVVANHADYNVTTGLTIMGWCASTAGSPASIRTLIRKAAGASDWWIRQLSGGAWEARIYTGGGAKTITSSAMTDGRRRFLAATYDGSVVQFYIDGVLIGTSASDASGISTTASGVGVGHNAAGVGSEGMLGRIAHVAVLTRALSIGEINHLHALGSGR